MTHETTDEMLIEMIRSQKVSEELQVDRYAILRAGKRRVKRRRIASAIAAFGAVGLISVGTVFWAKDFGSPPITLPSSAAAERFGLGVLAEAPDATDTIPQNHSTDAIQEGSARLIGTKIDDLALSTNYFAAVQNDGQGVCLIAVLANSSTGVECVDASVFAAQGLEINIRLGPTTPDLTALVVPDDFKTDALNTKWRLLSGNLWTLRPVFPSNASGQTYGVITDGVTPTLIKAIATNGSEGYIYSTDTSDRTEVPVFLSDGATQIGVFRHG